MALPLPNLDDRRWADLVQEGRALIPVYAPEWTDHNLHDPGITLVELLAWVAEQDIYRVNHVGAEHRRKFLALVGVAPAPPRAARVVLAFTLAPGSAPVALPAGVELAARDASGGATAFRTLGPLHAVPGELGAVVLRHGGAFRDVTQRWRAGEPLAVFGEDAAVGAELYLGFTEPLPPGAAVTLCLAFAGPRNGEVERHRLLAERGTATLPPHHGVRTAWEALAAVGAGSRWIALDPARGEIADDTRALTLDGVVRLRLPRPMARARVGPSAAELHWLRVRVAAGAYDAAPRLRRAAFNAARAEQAVAAAPLTWTVAPGAAVAGPTPAVGSTSGLRATFDGSGCVASLTFTDDAPRWLVLAWAPPAGGKTGSISLEAVDLGSGNGRPRQTLAIPGAPVDEASLELWSLEGPRWQRWYRRPDLDASGRADRHVLLDATRGVLAFGDGEHGLAPAAGARVLARCRVTRAEAGNLPAGARLELLDGPHDRAVLPDRGALRQAISAVTCVDGATGGAATEPLDHAASRAADAAGSSPRAVTLQDYEALALDTPGTRVVRAKAFAGLHPAFPCFRATGMVTVIVVPELPPGRPMPSPGLLAAVHAMLARRRPLGTRVEVVGPGYVEVAVRAELQAERGVDPARLQERAASRLDDFLDPLHGGLEGTGWPFGRQVIRAEVLQVLNQVEGVAHVRSLEFLVGGRACDAECGNVCLRPTELVVAGAHDVRIR